MDNGYLQEGEVYYAGVVGLHNVGTPLTIRSHGAAERQDISIRFGVTALHRKTKHDIDA
jgi:hypothetical protein